MDITRLRYFCTVAKTGSLREASDVLHISPAALSKSIKLFESELGVTLLLPMGRGITVSPEGKYLAQKGEEMLLQVSKLKDSLKFKQEKNTLFIRIGSFEVFTTYFLGPLVKDQLSDYVISLHEFIPGRLETALLEEKIDIGITYIPIPTPELEHIKLAPVQMDCYSLNGAFNKMVFSDIPFAVPVEPVQGAPTKVQGLDGWPDDRIPRNLKYRVTLMESAMELCRQGLAASYLPSFVVKLHNEKVKDKYKLVRLPQAEKQRSKLDVYVVKRKSDLENKAFRKIAVEIRKICAE